MLARAHTAGILNGWVTADEAYGQNRGFRDWLAAHEVPFVLATRSDDLLTCPDGRRHEAKDLVVLAGPGGWERRGAGAGAHGERLYDWAVLALNPAGLPSGWGHWLLVRRQIDPPPGKDPELAFYRCAGPAATPVPELIRVGGARWAVEECFQTAKNEAGLDHYQVRDWRAWYAHITLAMFAAAYLAVTRAAEHDRDRAAKKGTRCRWRRPDPVVGQRDPPPARRARPHTRHLRRQHVPLVELATTTATPGTCLPLPPTRPSTTLTKVPVGNACRTRTRTQPRERRLRLNRVASQFGSVLALLFRWQETGPVWGPSAGGSEECHDM